MNKRLIALLISLTLGFICFTPSYAEDLMQVYDQALHSDPTYQNAIATFRDKREILPQSIANMLPNIIGTANTTYNRDKFPGGFTPNFNSHGYQVTLTQPIINFGNWLTVTSANASVKSQLATLAAAKQNLMIRVATAYFNVLYAQDSLRYTIAQKRAIYKQLEQTTQRYKVGLESITTVYEAQANYDSLVAAEIAGRNNVNNQFEALRQITGVFYTHLAPLKRIIPLQRPLPNNLDMWVDEAEHLNLTLWSNRYAVIAARENIKEQFSGHLPTINGVLQYQDNASGAPLAATATTASVGKQNIAALQLTFPIFEGGAVVSKTRQAQAQYLESTTAMETTHRLIIATTRQTFTSILSGISQIMADRQAIISHISAVNGTEAAFKVGTRTIVDVLNDQQALTQAQQTYAQDQYNYINNILLLKQAAGILNECDLDRINTWLDPNAKAQPDYSTSSAVMVEQPKLEADAPQPITHVENNKAKLATKVEDKTTVSALKIKPASTEHASQIHQTNQKS